MLLEGVRSLHNAVALRKGVGILRWPLGLGYSRHEMYSQQKYYHRGGSLDTDPGDRCQGGRKYFYHTIGEYDIIFTLRLDLMLAIRNTCDARSWVVKCFDKSGMLSWPYRAIVVTSSPTIGITVCYERTDLYQLAKASCQTQYLWAHSQLSGLR